MIVYKDKSGKVVAVEFDDGRLEIPEDSPLAKQKAQAGKSDIKKGRKVRHAGAKYQPPARATRPRVGQERGDAPDPEVGEL